MSSFHLQIVTPDGLFYDGEAESISVRAVTGNLTILPRHINFVTPLGMGAAKVVTNGQPRMAACIGGMLAVTDGQVRVIATTFEWVEQIDAARAQRALERAQQKLAAPELLSKQEYLLAEAELKRALIRTNLVKPQ
ncbi:MAG: ATP synthase F1 subunit epsilon [Clostridiales bacterium]|nr:ATP synthase F1 subunit epsilon [Clostridiales bacterium]